MIWTLVGALISHYIGYRIAGRPGLLIALLSGSLFFTSTVFVATLDAAARESENFAHFFAYLGALGRGTAVSLLPWLAGFVVVLIGAAVADRSGKRVKST
ncbi:MAG: hypothetical protein IM674_02780 [Brevundimonas sp.]|nr:hypothetical protein [Brevundimonas sp.]